MIRTRDQLGTASFLVSILLAAMLLLVMRNVQPTVYEVELLSGILIGIAGGLTKVGSP
jgi:hypothetical protein